MSSRLSQKRQLEYLQLLIAHGADVNRLYDVYGDKSTSSQRWISHQMKRFENFCSIMERSLPKSCWQNLRDIAFEFKSQFGSTDFTQLVIDHFSKNFGPVESQSIVEIASDGHPLTIHVIKPSSQRKVLTLFTTGMSSRPMAVPQGVRGSKYAELYIQLPPTLGLQSF